MLLMFYGIAPFTSLTHELNMPPHLAWYLHGKRRKSSDLRSLHTKLETTTLLISGGTSLSPHHFLILRYSHSLCKFWLHQVTLWDCRSPIRYNPKFLKRFLGFLGLCWIWFKDWRLKNHWIIKELLLPMGTTKVGPNLCRPYGLWNAAWTSHIPNCGDWWSHINELFGVHQPQFSTIYIN